MKFIRGLTASAFKVSFLVLDVFHRFLRFQVIYALDAICLSWFPTNLCGFLKACLSLPLCPMQILLVQKYLHQIGRNSFYFGWGLLGVKIEELAEKYSTLYTSFSLLQLMPINMFFFYFKIPCCGVLFIISVLRMNFPLLTWYTEVCCRDGFKGIPKLCIF